MIDRDELVISGIGAVTSIGVGVSDCWSTLSSNNFSNKVLRRIDLNYQSDLLDKKTKNLDRTTIMSLYAAKLAIEDASLYIDDGNRENIGVVVGSNQGSLKSIVDFDMISLKNGPKFVNPATFPNVVMCSAASQIAIRHKITGFTITISSRFNSFYDALHYASVMLNSDQIKYIVLGGVEEYCQQTEYVFERFGWHRAALDSEIFESLPFGFNRNSAVLSEAAVFYVIEKKTTALKRLAKNYGAIDLIEIESTFSRECSTAKGIYKNASLIAKYFTDQYGGIKNKEVFQVLDSSANGVRAKDTLEFLVASEICRTLKTSAPTTSIKAAVGETYSASGAMQLLGLLFMLNKNKIYGCGANDVKRRSSSLRVNKHLKNQVVTKAAALSTGLGWPSYFIQCSKKTR